MQTNDLLLAILEKEWVNVQKGTECKPVTHVKKDINGMWEQVQATNAMFAPTTKAIVHEWTK